MSILQSEMPAEAGILVFEMPAVLCFDRDNHRVPVRYNDEKGKKCVTFTPCNTLVRGTFPKQWALSQLPYT